MTTSSQTPGPMPPETVPAATPAQAAVVFAAYGQVLPGQVGTTYADPWEGSDVPYALRSPFPEPLSEGPQCCMCGVPAGVEETRLRPDPKGRRYPSGAQVFYCLPHLPQTTSVRAAAGVIAAAMTHGAATARELAQAEADAGLLFDPQRAEEIAAAAAQQAYAEDDEEMTERGRRLAEMAGAQRQVDAVGRLIEGRPGWHLLPVAEIAAAVEYAKTAHDGSPPMTLTWSGSAEVPDAHAAHKQVVVECISSYGGRADLVVDGVQRAALASLVDDEVRDIHAKCPTPGCGEAAEAEASDLFGWSRLEIASLNLGPRWYCCDVCVVDALARAGHEIAAADRAAAVDPGEQAYDEASYLDGQYGQGASDEHALQQAEATAAGFADERGDADEERAL
ncbi:hypothetical protein [Streptomyces sp. NPDC101776]|uniref:hypothetical protein n=1 Tax=Streptomyces sp. NPDC101776 TaxID=3366146 RepID=UPI003801016D